MIKPGWQIVINSSDEPVPPFGVMQITGVNSDGFVTIDKPNQGERPDLILINGVAPIHPGGAGQGHRTFPAIVAYQPQSNDEEEDQQPTPGEHLGARSDSWFLHRGKRGFVVVGGAGDGLANVVQEKKIIPRYGYEPVRLFTDTLDAYTRTGSVLTSSAASQIGPFDGIVPQVGDRILYNQASAHIDNGIYEVIRVGEDAVSGSGGTDGSTWILRRTWDCDDDDDLKKGYKVFVQEGDDHAGETWILGRGSVINSATIHFTSNESEDTSCEPFTYRYFCETNADGTKTRHEYREYCDRPIVHVRDTQECCNFDCTLDSGSGSCTPYCASFTPPSSICVSFTPSAAGELAGLQATSAEYPYVDSDFGHVWYDAEHWDSFPRPFEAGQVHIPGDPTVECWSGVSILFAGGSLRGENYSSEGVPFICDPFSASTELYYPGGSISQGTLTIAAGSCSESSGSGSGSGSGSSGIQTTCCGDTIPTGLTLSAINGSGCFACMDGNSTPVTHASGASWTVAIGGGGNTITFALTCTAGSWELQIQVSGSGGFGCSFSGYTGGTYPSNSQSCNPLEVAFNVSTSFDGGGSMTILVTE